MSSVRFDHRFIAPASFDASRAEWRTGAWPEARDDSPIARGPRQRA
jgi:hypothetical protein